MTMINEQFFIRGLSVVSVLMAIILSGCFSVPDSGSKFGLKLVPKLGPKAVPAQTDKTGNHRSPFIVVNISKQKLFLMNKGKIIRSFDVSTAYHGIGNKSGSHKTPLGKHRIKYKIGDGVPIGGIFKGRKYIHQIATIHKDKTDIPEDLITTRILSLEGLEPGLNKGKGIDSFERHIYIHGTSEEGLIGHPASEGCVRMRNADVLALYNLVHEGTLVYIQK
ncbi:L,D-transpeptidase [Candidatus Sororendozoicomonas aggregata]|uniref:L,D-transpeptidase n=1 Tax=Candidatus Sororendozoicomonas aggregata TaxID=3073239 RepID=UPI002ECFE20E